MKIRLLIDQRTGNPDKDSGVFIDHTSTILEQEWEIFQHTGSQIDTLAFILHDPTATTLVEQGQDVLVEDFTNPSIRHFGGVIVDVGIVTVGIGRYLLIEAQDYTILADRNTVRKVYVLETDQAIIQDAFTEAGVLEVVTSKEVDQIRASLTLNFQGSTLRSVMDTIASITNASWFIDSFKVLHYKPKGAVSTTKNFSDNPDDSTTFPIYNWKMNKQLGEWNVLELQGGKDVSVDLTDVYSGDGSTTIYITGEQSGTNPIDRAPSTADIVLIDKNTGTDGTPVWTAQTVAHESADDAGTADVIWNPDNGRVEFAVAPPNFATNSWRITGRYLVDTIVIAQDSEAIARAGRIYKGSLTIPEAVTLAEANDLAVAWLKEHSDRIMIRFDTNEDGVELDRTTQITHSISGITAEDAFIYGLGIRLIGAETAEYTIEAEILNSLIFVPS